MLKELVSLLKNDKTETASTRSATAKLLFFFFEKKKKSSTSEVEEKRQEYKAMCTLTQAYRNEKEALLVQTSVLLRGVSSVYKVKMI